MNVPIFEETVAFIYSEENGVSQKMKWTEIKSFGLGRLCQEMLKQCSPVIGEYLSEALKNSMMEKNPDFSKLAKFNPIFEKGDNISSENYKPISVF